MTILKGYQPAHVVRYFEEICAIPHPSHHEQALCAYIRGCAERYGHRYVEDAAGNLMVYLNATPGYEDKAPMLLQAHMDMVSAKEPGSNHNFLTDPIRLHIEDGHYLYADDTTLGADNAVGLVNMLALMEDDTVVHPPMELLFTVCEEDGMEGIRQLDMSTIRSRRMLNMDCGDPDVMCVSCAGFVHYVMRLPVTAAGAAGQAYTLQIDGLAGGHSGLMIGTGRASAVVLMGRVLCELLRKVPCRIVSVDCERTMGIAPHMQAEIVLKPEQEPDARKVLEDLLAALSSQHVTVHTNEEPDFDYMENGDVAFVVKNPHNDENLLIELGGEFSLFFGLWHGQYKAVEYDYDRMKKDIAAILAEADCTLADIVKTTIFLKDLNDFAAVNEAYGKFFPKNPPARACVQVAKLPRDAKVEIEAIAVKG